MAGRPKLPLLDKQFLGLAPIWIEQISNSVRQIQRQGTTILIAEQMTRTALRLEHRGYIIRAGMVRHEGPMGQIGHLAFAEEYL